MFESLPLPVELLATAAVVLAAALSLPVLALWLDHVALPLLIRVGAERSAASAKPSGTTPQPPTTGQVLRAGQRTLLESPDASGPGLGDTSTGAVPGGSARGGTRIAVPLSAAVPLLPALALLPFAPGWTAAPLEAGVVWAFVLLLVATVLPRAVRLATSVGDRQTSAGGIGVTTAGAALVITGTSTAVAAGTLSLSGIAAQWQGWWLLWQLPAAVIFLLAALRLLDRPPVVRPGTAAGTGRRHGDHRGPARATLFAADYLGLVVTAWLFAVLFLGGWSGPWSDSLGLVWTALKVLIVIAGLVAARALPHSGRTAQVLHQVGRWALPLALTHLALVALTVVVLT